MPFVTRKSLLALGVLAVASVVVVGGFAWSGLYNIGADDQHWRPTYALLETLRERSIDTRAHKLPLPTDLSDPARVAQGAGNYDAMCTGCHLAPGMTETELSKGLYPAPPNLTKERVDAAEAFWVIKHGIKASGMPAWGKSMGDEYIWNMAAFLQKLPKLDEAQYQSLVARSGGHSHGGGETQPHGHAEGMADDHTAMEMSGETKPHAHPPGTPPHKDAPQAKAPRKEAQPHTHAPGTPPHNDAAPAEPAATPPEPTPAKHDAHDDHEHQH